jgi:hypothetical protein
MPNRATREIRANDDVLTWEGAVEVEHTAEWSRGWRLQHSRLELFASEDLKGAVDQSKKLDFTRESSLVLLGNAQNIAGYALGLTGAPSGQQGHDQDDHDRGRDQRAVSLESFHQAFRGHDDYFLLLGLRLLLRPLFPSTTARTADPAPDRVMAASLVPR